MGLKARWPQGPILLLAPFIHVDLDKLFKLLAPSFVRGKFRLSKKRTCW